MKIKPILPSLKEKKRYIAFEVISEDKLDNKKIEKSIKETLINFVGELNLAKANIQILGIKKNKGIIKTNTKYLDQIKSALILIKNINDEKVIIKTKGVSGILNRIKKFLK